MCVYIYIYIYTATFHGPRFAGTRKNDTGLQIRRIRDLRQCCFGCIPPTSHTRGMKCFFGTVV